MAVAGVILNTISLVICIVVFLAFMGMLGYVNTTDFNYFFYYDLGNLFGGGNYY